MNRAVFVLLALAPAAIAQEKSRDLIIGRWLVKPKQDDVLEYVQEYTKDGATTVTITVKSTGSEYVGKGTYKFLDDKTIQTVIEITIAGEKKTVKEEWTIKVMRDELRRRKGDAPEEVFQRAKVNR